MQKVNTAFVFGKGTRNRSTKDREKGSKKFKSPEMHIYPQFCNLNSRDNFLVQCRLYLPRPARGKKLMGLKYGNDEQTE